MTTIKHVFKFLITLSTCIGLSSCINKENKSTKTIVIEETPKYKLTGIYKYTYEYNTNDLIEDHYLEFTKGKVFYYGTSDDFDEAREGYLPGFFRVKIKNLKKNEKSIEFNINITNSDIYNSSITPQKTPKNNTLWEIDIVHNTRIYKGEINKDTIVISTKGFDSRLFIKI